MEKIGYSVKRLQQFIRVVMDKELKRLPLTTAQYAALSALEQNPKASNAALSRACFVTPQSMLDMVKSLETAGYITRKAHPEHGRIIETLLTPSGAAKLTTAHDLVNQIEQRMLTGLDEAEQQKLNSLLAQCAKNLE